MVQGRPSTDVLGCFSFESGFVPPVAQGPQTGPPKTSSHASSCATPNHWPFFFFLKQLHLSLSLARKSHASQCRYKVWVPALQAYISLYSLAPGGRIREEVISTVWLCLPQASPGQKCVLLLITLTQAVLVPERLGEATAGTQAKAA